MATPGPNPPVPKAFISYSWDDDAHKEWVKQLATRLRADGIDVTLDRWHAAPGEQIPAFMERAVRENDFVIAVCTPRFKERSDQRGGGVGYEGDIMTAYAFTGAAKKKFIPVLRRGSWTEAAPTWLLGRAYIDLSDDQYSKSGYQELMRTLHGAREAAPAIGPRPNFGDNEGPQASPPPEPQPQSPVRRVPGQIPSGTDPRSILLERQRTDFIIRRLDKYIPGGIPIPLRLEVQPGAVRRVIDDVISAPGQRPHLLPSDKSILDYFDESQKAILILGEAGSGKTILLLRLLDKLLIRAAQDQSRSHPIPVFFSLSSWAKSQPPVLDWQIGELQRLYGVDPRLAREWVEAGQILPLLDSLDEVRSDLRVACVDKINEYRGTHGLMPTVVCCRTEVYKTLPKLLLYDAVEVQPMTDEDVIDHLHLLDSADPNVRHAIEHLGQAIRREPKIGGLLRSPLIFYVLMSIYSVEKNCIQMADWSANEPWETLWSAYVDEMYEHRKAGVEYTVSQTKKWLSWLAWQMSQEKKEGPFFLDRLQPRWLSSRGLRLYLPCASLSFGLVIGSAVAVIYGLTYGWGWGLYSATISGIGAMLFGPQLDKVGFLRTTEQQTDEIAYGEGMKWSWQNAKKLIESQRTIRITFALALGSLIGVIKSSRIAADGLGSHYAALWGFAFALMYAVIGWLFLGLLCLVPGGLVQREIDRKTQPNRGIIRSLQNSVIYAAIYMLVFGLFTGIIIFSLYATIGIPGNGPKSVAGITLGAGILGGLLHGGSTVIKHFVVRLLLALEGVAPLRYVRFLDFACDRILLNRFGNGFVFYHDLLRTHFASLWNPMPTGRERQPDAKS
jgi:hypothetical protein